MKCVPEAHEQIVIKVVTLMFPHLAAFVWLKHLMFLKPFLTALGWMVYEPEQIHNRPKVRLRGHKHNL